MRTYSLFKFLLPLVLLFASCKKTDSSQQPAGDNTPTSKGLYRIQIGTGPATDTVKYISLNSNGTIKMVADSLELVYATTYYDTLAAYYDANSLLTSIRHKYDGSVFANFQYNSNGQLTQVDIKPGQTGSQERYVYTYTNNILSQKDWSNDWSGSFTPEETFKYTITNGNITEIKEYSTLGNNLNSDETFTYGTQVNPFKQLCLFNITGTLGRQGIAAADSYFNTNLIASSTANGITATRTNTFNSDQLPITVIANYPSGYQNPSNPVRIFTWQFFYH